MQAACLGSVSWKESWVRLLPNPVPNRHETAVCWSGNEQFMQAAIPIRLHLLAAKRSQEQAALDVHSGSSWHLGLPPHPCPCSMSVVNGPLCLVLCCHGY